MVTTQLDFMHIRSVTGLARQIRRIARRMKRRDYINALKSLSQKIDEAIATGNASKAEKIILSEIKKADHMDDNLALIIKDEMIVLNEEEKTTEKEIKYDSDLKSLVAELDDNSKRVFEMEILVPLRRMSSLNRATADRIRRVLDALAGDNNAMVEIQRASASLLGDRWTEKIIKMDAGKQGRDIEMEQKIINKLVDDMRKMTIFIKKGGDENKTEAKKILTKIIVEDKNLFSAMEDELKFLTDVILRSSILYVHLMKFLTELPKKLEEFKQTGYPKGRLDELNKKKSELFIHITKHREHMYQLAKYEDKGARVISG